MRFFEEIGEAGQAVTRYFYTSQAQLPEHVVPFIQGQLIGSPVDLVVNFTKAIYANRDKVPAEAKLIAAGTADLINRKGYHDRLDGRAAGMSDAMRRDAGEKAATGHSWPKPEADPVADREFLPPPAAEEPPAGAEA